MLSLHSNEILNETKVGTRDSGIKSTVLIIFLGKMWTFRFSIRKAVADFEWSLVDHPSWIREENSAGSSIHCKSLTQEVSKEKRISNLEIILVIVW